jgi:hypothetical protein
MPRRDLWFASHSICLPHRHHQRPGTSNEWKDRCTTGNALRLFLLPQPDLSCRPHRSLRDSVPHVKNPTISCRAASNLIRTHPICFPSDPFMKPPTGLLWSDPKLSPIHGSIIKCSPNVNGGLSTPERSSFTRSASLTSTLSQHFSKAL